MIKNPKGAGRKRKYPIETKPTSIRISARDKQFLIAKYGSVQKFVSETIKHLRESDELRQNKKGFALFNIK